jgi:2-polyprenyl-3-methyl-5-hydroxy-6-metoxy-1,4-benzoquinol methylase
MQQTPAHELHNADLLALIPTTVRRIVDVGCSSGALAREYKRLNPGCRYVGVDISPEYAVLAHRHCDEVHTLDVENADDATLAKFDADCWVFGDVLEHLRDPWSVLSKVRSTIPADGYVVACIPNAQHWSVQARLSCGLFRYEDIGLLDRTHLRWFTRITILEMFEQAGFTIADFRPRVFDEPLSERVLPAVEVMARCLGANVEQAQQAVDDAKVFQYVVRAVPAAPVM